MQENKIQSTITEPFRESHNICYHGQRDMLCYHGQHDMLSCTN